MARKAEPGPQKRARSFDIASDLAALSGNIAEIDASYGETLRVLLPQRLADLAPRFARAA
jgi:hypothetical protein